MTLSVVAKSLAVSAMVGGSSAIVLNLGNNPRTSPLTYKDPRAAVAYSVIRNALFTGTTWALSQWMGSEKGQFFAALPYRTLDLSLLKPEKFTAAFQSGLEDRQTLQATIAGIALFIVSAQIAKDIANRLYFPHKQDPKLTYKDLGILEGSQLLASQFILS